MCSVSDDKAARLRMTSPSDDVIFCGCSNAASCLPSPDSTTRNATTPPPAPVATPVSSTPSLAPRFEEVKAWILIDSHYEQIDSVRLACPSAVDYDDSLFYVPEFDPRWAVRTRALHGRQFPPAAALESEQPCMDFNEKYPVLVREGRKFGVAFTGMKPRVIELNGKKWTVPLDRPRMCAGGSALLAFGGPGHEVIIDDKWYNVPFGGDTKAVTTTDGKKFRVRLPGKQPEVKVLGEVRTSYDIEQLNMKIDFSPRLAECPTRISPPPPVTFPLPSPDESDATHRHQTFGRQTTIESLHHKNCDFDVGERRAGHTDDNWKREDGENRRNSRDSRTDDRPRTSSRHGHGDSHRSDGRGHRGGGSGRHGSGGNDAGKRARGDCGHDVRELTKEACCRVRFARGPSSPRLQELD